MHGGSFRRHFRLILQRKGNKDQENLSRKVDQRLDHTKKGAIVPPMNTNTTPTPVLEDLDKEARAIDSLGLRYQVTTIDLRDIDLIGSETFNQRFDGRSNDDVVVSYAMLMERGVKFPKGTVFYDTVARKYKIVSGFHRTLARKEAHEAHPDRGFDKFEMFEIIVSPPGHPGTMQKIEDLGYLLNTTGVYGLSQSERYAAAIRVITERGVETTVAAEQFGLDSNQLEHELESHLADKELLRLGLDPSVFTRLKDKKIVVTLPDTFWMREAQKLLQNYRTADGQPIINQADFYNFVRYIIVNKGDAERKQKLLETQELLAQGRKPRSSSLKGASRPFSISGVWKRGVVALNQVSAVDLVNATAKTQDSAEIIRDEIAHARAALDDIEKALDAKWDH